MIRILTLLGGVLTLFASIGPFDTRPAAAATGNVLVYSGEGALDEGYTQFGTATGKTVTTLAVLPPDLTVYDCVILPINGTSGPAFSTPSTAALVAYVNNGGRVIAEAERMQFPGAIAAMNGLAAAMASGLSVVAADIDPDFIVTTSIDSSPFTAGVSSIRYAASSGVAVMVGSNAQSLVRSSISGTNPGTTIVGIDKIGTGVFALFGDSNILSDNSGGGYASNDNGVLAANLCGKVSFCPQDPTAKLTAVVDGNAFKTVQDAYDAATDGAVIGIFSNTTENVVLGGDKTLKITQCTTARITAADNSLPVWTVASTGKLTIIGPDAENGSIGWLVESDGHDIKGVRATGASQVGIEITGDNNSVSFNSVSGSPLGVKIEGTGNDVRGGTVSDNGTGVESSAAAEQQPLPRRQSAQQHRPRHRGRGAWQYPRRQPGQRKHR